MSEKLFKFFLSEIKRIRLVCQEPKCKAVAEVSSDLLRQGPLTIQCKFCGNVFFPKLQDSPSPLALLGDAMRYLEERTEHVKVEFSIPVCEKAATQP